MNDELREEIALNLADLDKLAPSREGLVRLRGSRNGFSVEADRAGFVRFGLMLIHAGVDTNFDEPDLDQLLTRDSTAVVEKFILRVKDLDLLDPGEERQNTVKVALTVLFGTVGVIAAVTVLCYLLSLLMHHHI